jgi:hypothetical protein
MDPRSYSPLPQAAVPATYGTIATPTQAATQTSFMPSGNNASVTPHTAMQTPIAATSMQGTMPQPTGTSMSGMTGMPQLSHATTTAVPPLSQTTHAMYRTDMQPHTPEKSTNIVAVILMTIIAVLLIVFALLYYRGAQIYAAQNGEASIQNNF